VIRLEIRGKRPTPLEIELDHATYCVGSGKCECERRVVPTTHHDRSTGTRRARPVEVLAPRTVTIHQGLPSELLHEAALQCPGVVAALKARTVRVVPSFNHTNLGIGQAPNPGPGGLEDV
jgi:hypothetical protein